MSDGMRSEQRRKPIPYPEKFKREDEAKRDRDRYAGHPIGTVRRG